MYNWLKNWNFSQNNTIINYPNGYENKLVTYIGLNEARLYCQWIGKKLPHSYEWQYAAQGNNTQYLYPWGNQQNEGINYPKTNHGRNIIGPEDVDAYSPNGDSMFGVSDLIGNVWQYTDEFYDIHTRSVILRGSSNYYPITNTSFDINWYFPTAFQLNQHGKYFIMDNSWERSGTVGFRCAADSIQPNLTNNKVFNWNGIGNYCVDRNGKNNDNVILCGSIQPPDGYNNLTKIGDIDWVQFGLNDGIKDKWHIIRKLDGMVINNFSVSTGGGNNDDDIYVYDDNINAFYWNDGDISEYQVLTMNNASTYGLYIVPSNNNNDNRGFQFNLENLKAGNVYNIKIYVGVWGISAHLRAKIKTQNNEQYIFEDKTVSALSGITENVLYELIINLSSMSENDIISVLIEWLIQNEAKEEDGNITLQCVAVARLS